MFSPFSISKLRATLETFQAAIEAIVAGKENTNVNHGAAAKHLRKP